MMLPALLLSQLALAADPIAHLGLVTAKLQLTPEEVAQLRARRMIVIDADTGTYIGTYRRIYKNDLPLVITADSLLYPLHGIFNTRVAGEEGALLLPDLVTALEAMQRGVGRISSPEARKDVDLYLAVALALATQPDEAHLVARCQDSTLSAFAEQLLGRLRDGWLDEREFWAGGAAQAPFQVSLQGGMRTLDPAAFVPGLPYDTPEGQRWFRAITWLREGGFLLSHVEPGGALRPDRRAALGALWLSWLAQTPAAGPHLRRIHGFLEAIYGPPEGADPDALSAWMAGRRPAELAQVEGWEVDLTEGAVGRVAALGGASRFALVNPSVAVDSEVLGGLAPVGERPSTAGLLAALGNADALGWVSEGERARATTLAGRLDALPEAAWTGSVRQRWLGAVRALGQERQQPMPAPWGLDVGARRVGMVQLQAWTWLRHDMRLFAPAGTEGGCSFPRVIVEPFPAFYEALAGTAGAIRDALASVGDTRLQPHLDGYATTLLHLRDIAAQERAGAPLSTADQRWLKGALSFPPANEYDGDAMDGWYPSLYLDLPEYTLSEAVVNWERVVADVYLRPASGDDPGEILHVGTGHLRYMAVIADTCDGPVAAVGPTQDLHEIWTPGAQALSDQTWTGWFLGGGDGRPSKDPGWIPPRAEWLGPLYGPARPVEQPWE